MDQPQLLNLNIPLDEIAKHLGMMHLRELTILVELERLQAENERLHQRLATGSEKKTAWDSE